MKDREQATPSSNNRSLGTPEGNPPRRRTREQEAPPSILATLLGRKNGRARQLVSHALAFSSLAAILFVTGCRQDMHNEPKMIPQRGTDFFADHRGARPQVEGTVARNQGDEDSYFYTGVMQGPNGYKQEQDLMPFPVTMTVLRRGQERFNVYCTPCHSRVGNGLGEIVMRGYKPAANLHDQVRRSQPLSHYFYVMTHGYGACQIIRRSLLPRIVGRLQLTFARCN